MEHLDLTMAQSQWLRSMHERYPVLFGSIAMSEEQRYELPAGWRGLVEDAAVELISMPGSPAVIGRLKEKMGSLRIQLLDTSAEAYDIVMRADQQSLTTCAECGHTCEPVPMYNTPCCAACAMS